MRVLSSVLDIASAYRGMLIDLWGVIHDGVRPYEGARETVAALHEAGVSIVFLSNAPRRAAVAVEMLDRFGIERHWYREVITSGEVAYRLCEARTHLPYHDLPFSYVYTGLPRDAVVLDGLGYREVGIERAGFILNAGLDTLEQVPAEKEAFLKAALARKLPMLCINPDVTIVRLDGTTIYCAGALAERYAAMGGVVHQLGKPYPDVYKVAMAALGITNPAEILAVGDNPDTDILGGQRMGCATLLITGGILSVELAEEIDALGLEPAMARLAGQKSLAIDYLAARFA
jgi:HAD superfamily hydrolase (TIGR01459 family)